MSKLARIVLCLSALAVSVCAVSQEKLDSAVSDFIQLLVGTRQPTLDEYEQFSGECGGVPELTFVLNECRSRGWGVNSESCVDFSRQRCSEIGGEPSLELNWIRKHFSTVGKSYRLINVQSKSENVDLVEVKIGKNKFLLFHDSGAHPVGGLVVGISSVNGKKVTEYFKE